jgi:hypothetical protein
MTSFEIPKELVREFCLPQYAVQWDFKQRPELISAHLFFEFHKEYSKDGTYITLSPEEVSIVSQKKIAFRAQGILLPKGNTSWFCLSHDKKDSSYLEFYIEHIDEGAEFIASNGSYARKLGIWSGKSEDNPGMFVSFYQHNLKDETPSLAVVSVANKITLEILTKLRTIGAVLPEDFCTKT